MPSHNDSLTPDHADRLQDHWWPRPGWRPGRIMCTWHLTFEDADELRQLAGAYQNALSSLPGLDLVPLRWLHLTIQSVGYLDDLSTNTLTAVTSAVREQLATVPAFTLTFHRAVLLGEAIGLRPEPLDPLRDLLVRIRTGITAATGQEARTGPEQAHGFRPHVSLAYSHTDAPARPYADALDATSAPPAVVDVGAVTLIDLDRRLTPEPVYCWTTRAVAPLAH